MKYFARALCLAAGMCAILADAAADIISYHPSSTLRLGGSFDPVDLSAVRPPCVTYDSEGPLDGVSGAPVSPKLSFFIRQITDFREFYSYMNISASVSGHYKMFSAGGSFNLEEENFSSSDSFSWVMGVSATYGRYRAVNPRLTAEAQRLADSGNLLEFVERCGLHVVLQVSRGINAAVVFTIKNLTERNRRSLTASFNASFGGGLWGLDASSNFEQQVRSLIEGGQISLDVRAVGGPGAGELAAIIKDLDRANIGKVRETLSRYVAKQGPDGSVPVEFQTGPLSSFVPKLGDPDRTTYLILIGELFVAQQENSYMLRKYRDFLRNSEDLDPNDPGVVKAIETINLLQKRLNEIGRSAIACRDLIRDIQTKGLATNVRGGERLPLVVPSDYSDAERRTSRAFQEMIEVLRSASLPYAKSGPNAVRNLEAAFSDPPRGFEKLKFEDLSECRVDPTWLEFERLPVLDKYPFLYEAWSNPLSQSPDHYLHARVKGKLVAEARVVDGSGNLLRILQATNTPDTFGGMVEISALDGGRYPIRLSVRMRSENTYLVEIVPAPQ